MNLEGESGVFASYEQVAPVSILSVVGNFVRRLRLPPTITWFRRVIGGSLHHLFKLDVRLGSKKDLAHLGDIVLQEVFVQRMCVL